MAIPEEYFDVEAPVGEGRRFQHDCTKKHDKSLVITRTRDGFAFYCHRCRVGGIRDLSGKSPREVARFMQTLNVRPIKTMIDMRLPLDYTKNIPAAGIAYLYTRGLLDRDIKRWKIGYSSKYNRIIFPVYEGHKLIFFQGRTTLVVTRDNPKWMNVYQSARKDTYFIANQMFSHEVVIVEDIISAVRVSYTADAYAMLSTHISEELILELSEKYDVIFLWLDPDKKVKTFNLVRRYRAFGINVHLITTGKDPKYYTNKEIRRFINEDCL